METRYATFHSSAQRYAVVLEPESLKSKMVILLIIDMQVASFTNSKRFDEQGVVSRINKLAKHIRKREGKVVFVQHDGTEEDGHKPHTPGWKILPSLIVNDSDIIINKTICDCFYKSDLLSVLRRHKCRKLIFSGCATDFCVDTTIRSAISHDFNVVVASDCHTTAGRPHLTAEKVIEHHNWIWNSLQVPVGRVDVLTSSTIISSNLTSA